MKSQLIGIYSAVLVAAFCPALADDIPPAETGDVQVNSRLVSGQLEIRDARNGFAIVVPKAPILTGFPSAIQTAVELRSQPTGADLVVTVQNTSNAAATLGSISTGIVNLGQSIESFDFRATSDPVHLDWSNYSAPAWLYPDDMYAPVFALRNGSYAVGISLQYPVMDYKHDVVVSLNNPRGGMMEGEGGPGWYAMFWLGNPLNHMTGRWASLAPGESRTYVMSIRVTRNPQEWQTTLLPYRDYFRAHYGGVKYTRGTTPILGAQLADQSLLSTSNPYGFGVQQRPDLHGWALTKAALLRDYGTWPIIMLWSPSGLYQHHTERNYPFQFTSHWNATSQLSQVYSATDGLPSLVASGKTLGLWWGRAAEVSTQWDTASFEPFDPDNPAHVQAAFNEMDGAVRAGATMIGLDTFMPYLTPVWKQYPWIQRLQQRYPTVSFCIETSCSDIMHTLTASFVPGWQPFTSRPASVDDVVTLRHANYLADFLNPGHETWGQLSYQEQVHWFGTRPSTDQIRTDIANFAAYGYRPLVNATVTYPTGIQAAQTWETTLPASIRDNDPYIADIRAGRLPGFAAGASEPPPQGSPPPPPAPPAGSDPPVIPPPSGSGSGSSGGSTYRPKGIFGLGMRPPAPGSGQSSGQNSGQSSGNTAIFHMHRPLLKKVQKPQGIIAHYIAKAHEDEGQ